MAALPPALSAYAFARQYDAWIEQASGVVPIGTLLSVVTLTAAMWLVQTKSLSRLLAQVGRPHHLWVVSPQVAIAAADFHPGRRWRGRVSFRLRAPRAR
jgi:hypothetical protein